MEGSTLEYGSIDNIPLPACVVGENGNIIKANEMMTEVFLYKDIEGANFFTLTGKKINEVTEAVERDENVIISRNDKFFSLISKENEDIGFGVVSVIFIDVTERELAQKRLEDERVSVILLEIDNYDELISSVTTDSKKAVPAEVDRLVRKWAGENNADITGISEDDYIIIASTGDVKRMIDDSFSILDQVRNIDAKIDFPVSISLGVGMSEQSIIESKSLAKAALDLALGRGGDQAVVKTDGATSYYGGTLQSMEKNNRGKARVIAHALRRLIEESSMVMIAGH